MTINANITSLIRSGSFPQIQNAIQAGISQGMMTIDYYAKKLIENDYLDKDAYKKINIDD